ncbi:MAG: hypothetical protein PHD25_12475 [Bacteroidales bacterium]|nr:hypothetical protein [Bacteroidales bacterium]
MNLGLLICDHARKDLNHPDGSYPEMFRRILPDFEMRDYYVCDGVFPGSPVECDGWLISGSRKSVYDVVDWIIKLKKFIQMIKESGRPCIGVCFGHQMVGAALGGVVRKAPTGWCAGVHPFDIQMTEPWMEPPQSKVNLLMMCQDQVMELPPAARVIATSLMCPNAMILIGSNVLGIQGHPEFSVDFEHQLIRINAELMKPGQADEEIESLKKPAHRELVAGWMGAFLRMTDVR